MALAHPLHPIDNRSRNRCRNLWVGWCVSSWWPLFPSRSSVLIYLCILYVSSVIGHIYIYIVFGLSIVSCSLINSLTLGCLWLLVLALNSTLILGIWCSTIPHLPGCFCPWTFFQNIGFNMVPSDPCMSYLLNLDILPWSFRLCNWLACGVWCRGLTTCLLHFGPSFGNRLLIKSWAVDLT